MAWVVLVFAGLLETVWATGLKMVTEKPTPLWIGLTAISIAGSFLALYWAMARLPLALAYPIWTSIGSVGAVIIGVMYFGTQLTLVNILGVLLIVAGMFLLGSASH